MKTLEFIKRAVISVALVGGIFGAVEAVSQTAALWRLADGNTVNGMVMLCDYQPNDARRVVQCGGWSRPLRTLMMPFVRTAPGDPIILSGITTTAKQFNISRPGMATAYRMVNPCNVDIRIRKVNSLSQSVTSTTGTLYLARTTEVMGTSQPDFISVMSMREPVEPCTVELLYGDGS